MVWLPERGGIGVLFERGAAGRHGMDYVAVSFAVVGLGETVRVAGGGGVGNNTW